MKAEIDALIRAKNEVSLANEALKAVVWQPFCDLLDAGKIEEAIQMLSGIPEGSTRMLMYMKISEYDG